MSALGSKELGCKVATGFFVDVAALAGFTVLELGMRWEETLVVSWAAEGFFATSLGNVSHRLRNYRCNALTGSKVGLWAVVIFATVQRVLVYGRCKWMLKLEWHLNSEVHPDALVGGNTRLTARQKLSVISQPHDGSESLHAAHEPSILSLNNSPFHSFLTENHA